MKLAGASRIALAVALTLLAGSAVLMILSLLPRDWLESPPKPPPALRVEALVTAADARASISPNGATIDGSGRLTILSAPGSAGNPQPWPLEPSPWGSRPRSSQPVPPEMLAGIRALFRVLPPPPGTSEELRIVTLERRVAQGRLLLVDGCFRYDSPDGPHAVFPPGTRLAIKEGYLMIGPPGLPPELSARVGEEIFWEGGVSAITHAPSLRLVARFCGPGPAALVVPGSATVQQARNDGLAASDWMRTYGEADWDAALAAVQACRERMSRGVAEQFPTQPRRVMVDNMCGNIPPPVVTDPADCPSGSRLRAGVCVTPEGYRRPTAG